MVRRCRSLYLLKVLQNSFTFGDFHEDRFESDYLNASELYASRARKVFIVGVKLLNLLEALQGYAISKEDMGYVIRVYKGGEERTPHHCYYK